jgi:uncharacterized protein
MSTVSGTSVSNVGFVEMRLGKVVGLTTEEDGPSFCLVLDAVSQDRHLPMLIGQSEAFTLSASLTGTTFPRPMSPQFAAGLLHALRGRLLQVRIHLLAATDAGKAVYGASVQVEGASGIELVDARPSDALNLVALVPAQIFASEEVLADAEARLNGDSAEARLLHLALEAKQMTIHASPPAT